MVSGRLVGWLVGWLAVELLTEVTQAQRESGVRQRGELCGTWLEGRARVGVGVRARARVGVRVGVRGEMCGTAAAIRLLL